MVIVPYTFRNAHFISDSYRGYWVTLFCVFDGKSVHSFFHESDRTDNCIFMNELGVNFQLFHHDVLVTRDCFSDIFYSIEDYVQKSSFSGQS